jgi:apolipoprotein N-acyltransferase
MAIGGLLWIGLMLISEPPDAIANGIGETIWGAWVNVFLSILVLVAALAGSFCIMMGEERNKEASTLAILTIAGGWMFYEIMQNGSEGLEASGWHQIHWEQMMFLIGGLLGSVTAVLAFIALVYMAEKRAPDPDVIAPLTEEEKAVVDAVLRLNLELEGADE